MTAGRQFFLHLSVVLPADAKPILESGFLPFAAAASAGAHEYFCTPRAKASAIAPQNCKRL